MNVTLLAVMARPRNRLSRSFEGRVESSWEKGLKSSRPIESIVWQLSWVEVTDEGKVHSVVDDGCTHWIQHWGNGQNIGDLCG